MRNCLKCKSCHHIHISNLLLSILSRFVYKFVCNLKDLIGYDASELSRLVKEAGSKVSTS